MPTRKEIKELLPVIQAFAEGKTIQYFNISEGKWKDIPKGARVTFENDTSDYRIKPELKYRPFKTKDECWNEMLKHHPFGWVINENEDYLCLLSINKHFEEKDFSYMFRTYRFADGTPFGIGE